MFGSADTSVYEVEGLRVSEGAECVLAWLLGVRVALPLLSPARMRKVLLALSSNGKCVAVLIMGEESLKVCRTVLRGLRH